MMTIEQLLYSPHFSDSLDMAYTNSNKYIIEGNHLGALSELTAGVLKNLTPELLRQRLEVSKLMNYGEMIHAIIRYLDRLCEVLYVLGIELNYVIKYSKIIISFAKLDKRTLTSLFGQFDFMKYLLRAMNTHIIGMNQKDNQELRPIVYRTSKQYMAQINKLEVIDIFLNEGFQAAKFVFMARLYDQMYSSTIFSITRYQYGNPKRILRLRQLSDAGLDPRFDNISWLLNRGIEASQSAGDFQRASFLKIRKLESCIIYPSKKINISENDIDEYVQLIDKCSFKLEHMPIILRIKAILNRFLGCHHDDYLMHIANGVSFCVKYGFELNKKNLLRRVPPNDRQIVIDAALRQSQNS